MTLAIERLMDVNVKSWKSYTGPNEGFDLYNLFYGYNGAGKSSLAEAIANDLRERDCTQAFYSRSYIDTELLLQDGGSALKGVKVNFGKANVDSENRINELEIKKKKAEEDAQKHEEAAQSAKKDIFNAAEEITNERKGSLKIRKKQAETSRELVKAWESDLENARKKIPDFDFTGDYSVDNIDREITVINNILIPDSFTFEVSSLKELRKLLLKEYSDERIPSKCILDWLQKGHDIHRAENSNTCMFCGGILDLDEVRSRIDKYLQNERANDQKQLEKFQNDLSERQDQILSIQKQKKLINHFISQKDISEKVTKLLTLPPDDINRLREKNL